MPRILVAYYSRTGTVREVARRVAASLRADVEQIADPTPRAGVIGFMRSEIEAWRRRLPPIAPSERNPADYDLVVIGTPVWAASIASPVLAYLRRHRGDIRAAAFFTISRAMGSRRAFAQLQAEAGVEPLARMSLHQEDVSTVLAGLMIERFTAELAAVTPLPRAATHRPRPGEDLGLH